MHYAKARKAFRTLWSRIANRAEEFDGLRAVDMKEIVLGEMSKEDGIDYIKEFGTYLCIPCVISSGEKYLFKCNKCPVKIFRGEPIKGSGRCAAMGPYSYMKYRANADTIKQCATEIAKAEWYKKGE